MDIDRLKSQIVGSLDILSYYEGSLRCNIPAAQHDGWTKKFNCPFHDDTKTPNFAVNVNTGKFKCFACSAAGSIFDFWIKLRGLSPDDRTNFKDALIDLAGEAGVDISEWKHKVEHDFKNKPEIAQRPKKSSSGIPKVNKADAHDSANTPIDKDVYEGFHSSLTSEHYKWLLRERGLKKDAIERAKIGWDEDWYVGKGDQGNWLIGRYTIPILNKEGFCYNLRGYSNRAPNEHKMMNYVTGRKTPNERRHGSPPRLYGLNELLKEDWDHVVICEGEFDRILLTQQLKDFSLFNWGAVTGTHGVTKFEPEWLHYLYGKYIYLCFDCDEEGKLAATNIASKFFLDPLRAGKFAGVKIVTLPLDGSKDSNDITDFFVGTGHDIEDYIALCNDTPELFCGGVESDEATTEAEEVSSFVEALKDRKYIDKRIKVPLTISGATSHVYHAIREYKVTHCKLMKEGECCADGTGTQKIPYGHPLFIQCCMQKETANLKAIAEIACQKGQRCTIAAVRKVVMEEYFAHQVVERWKVEEDEEGHLRNAQELVQAPIYILQPSDNVQIEPKNYMATGYIRTHPQTSIATLFIEQLEELEDDWKQFSVNRADNRELIRTIKEDFTIDEIVSDITRGVTQIYDSDDILYAVLLTYLSPLWFNFNGSLIRGWLNSAIIGDSGTGKSATYLRVSDWLELGDTFSALSGTRTGLLYAIKRQSGEWHVSIGRYVQASCKIIAVDETQEIEASDIKRMGIAMDTGYLHVEQVASGGYHTQTRTIFLLNPKDANGKAATISDFVHGCDALRQCFDPMFIRRLDLAVFTTSAHEYNFYNQRTQEEGEIRITSRLFKTLVHWAWTRRPEQIHWKADSIDECLNQSTELSKLYGYADDIPLVNPQDFRLNLARLSTAYAILDRNFSEDLQHVTVEPRHVAAMANFVDGVYSSNVCNLAQKSKASAAKKTLTDFEKIDAAFRKAIEESKNSSNMYYSRGQHFCQMLLYLEQLEAIKKRDLAEQLGVRHKWVQSNMAILQGYNLVEMGKWGYKKTRKFNLFMQKWREDEDTESMLDSVFKKLGDQSLADTTQEEWAGSYDGSQNSDDPFGTSEDIKEEAEVDPF